jgi:hypothetical protein
MDSMTLQSVDEMSEESTQRDLVELWPSELDQVGAGTCDPGIIIIEK